MKLLLTIFLLIDFISLSCQLNYQTVKGFVFDSETLLPLSGANIIVIGNDTVSGTTTDTEGIFRIRTKTGRVKVTASFIGYEELTFNDVLVAAVKEAYLQFPLREKIYKTGEIVVSAYGRMSSSINHMASVSVKTIRTDDAMRYAGGFYDPSRIVSSFAGVATSNSEESNDIVIRGNSSRGLLWRLEGIEIPNPNHFSDGQGGSGGAYSAITSNAVAGFDFFTGAFPAEYGNALSGVMDLNLRKGNTDKSEFAFQTGMIGAEFSSEGPISSLNGASFMADARYVNFGLLDRLGIIDLGETNFAPRSCDFIMNINIPAAGNGNFNFFGFSGRSSIGKTASNNPADWITDRDRWEEKESLGVTVAGIKFMRTLSGGNSYIKMIASFSNFSDIYYEGSVDSSLQRTDSYSHSFKYPSFRYSFLLNHKEDSRNTLRTGLNFSILNARLEEYRLNPLKTYDTLVKPFASALLLQYYAQVKHRATEKFEINAGFHLMSFSLNGELTAEPRAGIKWKMGRRLNFIAGTGIHSRMESLQVYSNLVKNSYGILSAENSNLRFSKAFHFVSGLDFIAGENLSSRIEIYYQKLFNIPIVNKKNSRYSAINSAESLPSSRLENAGKGYNRGIEITIDKHYSGNYYGLFTLSLFRSKYKAGDQRWYNTYYNTSFVINLLAGKDFYLSGSGRSVLGVNARSFLRGGYRYTPVDMEKSLKYKRIIFDPALNYASQLPPFFRMDAGVSYRLNMKDWSLLLMADIQNLTGRKNVYRKRFSFSAGEIAETNYYSLGTIPVINIRVEF